MGRKHCGKRRNCSLFPQLTSNSTFSHSVFKRLVLQTRKNEGLFGKGLMIEWEMGGRGMLTIREKYLSIYFVALKRAIYVYCFKEMELKYWGFIKPSLFPDAARFPSSSL